MLIPRDQMKLRVWDNCHGGQGRTHLVEMLDKKHADPGFQYVSDMYVEAGASVGEHLHSDDEEIYYILEGEGEILLDGMPQPVRPGDLIYTRQGHRHALRAGPSRPMRVLVVITKP